MSPVPLDLVVAHAHAVAARRVAGRLAATVASAPLPIRDPDLARVRLAAARPPSWKAAVDRFERAVVLGVGCAGFLVAEALSLAALSVVAVFGRTDSYRLALVVGVAAECGMIAAFRLLWMLPLQAARRWEARRQAFRDLADTTDSVAYRRQKVLDTPCARVTPRLVACAVLVNVALAGLVAVMGFEKALAVFVLRPVHLLGIR